MVTMVKLITSLLGAAVVTSTVLPVHELHDLAVVNTSTTPGLQGGFIPHCSIHTVGKVGELKGRLLGMCGDDQPLSEQHSTWLNLNLCLANVNGVVVWGDHGQALESCTCTSRHFDTQFIECNCRDGHDGVWKDSALDLNEGIRYDMDRHVIACYGNLGVLN